MDKDEKELKKTKEDEIELTLSDEDDEEDDDDDDDGNSGGTRRLFTGLLLFVFIVLLLFVSIGALVKYNVINVDVAKGYINKITDKISGTSSEEPAQEVLNEPDDPTVPVIELKEEETYTNSNELLGLSFTYTLDKKNDTYSVEVKEDYSVPGAFAESPTILVYSKDFGLFFSVTINTESGVLEVSDIYKTEDLPDPDASTTPITFGDYNLYSVYYDREQMIVSAANSQTEEPVDTTPYTDSFKCKDYELFALGGNLTIDAKYNKTTHIYDFSISDAFSTTVPDETAGTSSNYYWCSISSNNVSVGDEYYEQRLNFSGEFLCYYNSETATWGLQNVTEIPTVTDAPATIDISTLLLIEPVNIYIAKVDTSDTHQLAIYDSTGTLLDLVDTSYFVTKSNKEESDAYTAYLKVVEDIYWKLDSAEWGDVSYSSINYSATDTYAIAAGLKKSVNELKVPDKVLGVTVGEIGVEAFSNHLDIKSVSIDGAKLIRKMAFSGCDSLSEVKISDGLIGIETGAFSGCNNLSITIPDSVQFISQKAFDLRNVTITCNKGSYAEAFAKKLNVKYILNDSKEPSEATNSSDTKKSAEATDTNNSDSTPADNEQSLPDDL